MTPSPSIWHFIENHRRDGNACVLLYVLNSVGSSPGRQGFCMAVTRDSQMYGSIGGGIMEHKWVEFAKKMLDENQRFSLVRDQIHQDGIGDNRSGMICSGEQKIFIHLIQDSDIPAVKAIAKSLDDKSTICLKLNPKGLQIVPDYSGDIQYLDFLDESNWSYHAVIGHKPSAHIIGGGHCSLALSQLLDSLGFRIYLYETRQELNTIAANHFIHKLEILPQYSKLEIPSDIQAYVVIMTFGYRTDKEAIQALTTKKFKYLGVLGSKNKMQQLLQELANQGVSSSFLDSIFTPIGLPIRSQTPMEIAVSIAAQMIQVKNKD